MKNELTNRILSSLVLIPLVFYCIFIGSFFFNFLILFCFLLTCYEWFKIISNKIFFFLGLIYLIFSYSTVFLIRNNFDDQGLNFFLFIILICISTDIGGYTFGKAFKGPKLTNISPNKTYSGMLGSFLLSILVSILFIKYSYQLNFDYYKLDLYLYLVIILVSGVSQIGDLIISYFKRLSNIKDTGKLIPGHGGILDRTDGMIFAFPFTYLLLKLNLF